MAAFAGFGPLVGHLPDDPLHRFGFASDIAREELTRLFGNIEHDGTGLEHHNRLTAANWVVIDQNRHAVIGVHLEEFGGELIAPADIAGNDLVRFAEFFE